jgi:hypothetical protein
MVRGIEEAVPAVRPLACSRVALRAMRQSATAAALAYAFRERLAPAEVALLTAPYRARVAEPEADG